MKKVSVIVPVYNVEEYLRKCLDSLVNQTLKEIEIIVVNDGSPDNSQVIIDEYTKKYKDKVKGYIKENGGLGSARNYGLKKATGEYIAYVDSDDYVELDMFEKMYHKAQEEDLDIVVCTLKNISEDKGYIDTEPLYLKSDDSKFNAFLSGVGVCNRIYKRTLLTNFEFKSGVWYEDLAFSCKVIMNAKNIGFINEGFYNYLKRPGSIMNNNNLKRNLEILDAFDDALDYIKKNPKFKKYYDEIEYLAIYHIYISAITRIINTTHVSGKKEIINELTKYMNQKFPNFKSNKYLPMLDRNKKIIYNLIGAKMYHTIRLIFMIKGILK